MDNKEKKSSENFVRQTLPYEAFRMCVQFGIIFI